MIPVAGVRRGGGGGVRGGGGASKKFAMTTGSTALSYGDSF